MSPAEIDTKSYDFYIKKQYDKLIELGNEAIDEGIDFYFLRMRMGVASYDKNNYASAIPQFERAVVFSPSDAVALEYLYYSYLLSGREDDAKILASGFPGKLKDKLKIKDSNISDGIYTVFDGIYTEGGYTFNAEYNKLSTLNLRGTEGVHGEQTILKNYRYNNLSLLHSFGSRVTGMQSYNNFSFSAVKMYDDLLAGKKEFDLKTTEIDYYLNLRFALAKGLSLTTAFRYMHINYDKVDFSIDSTVFPAVRLFTQGKGSSNEIVFSAALNKYMSDFLLGINGTYSNLNNATQYQAGMNLVYYPFGNLNLYTVTGLTYHMEKVPSKNFAYHWLYTQKAGVKILSKLWAEAGFTIGDILNYNELNAFSVYNNLENIKNRIEAGLIMPISGKLELSLTYKYYLAEHSYYTYFISKPQQTQIITYINHSINGGIKWTF